MGSGSQEELNLIELFDPPKARKSDPATSHKAASRIKALGIRHAILEVLVDGPKTSYEVAEVLSRDRDTVSPHFKPLALLDFVQRAGTKVRPTTQNRCEVWKITEEGMNWLEKHGSSQWRWTKTHRCPHCGGTL